MTLIILRSPAVFPPGLDLRLLIPQGHFEVPPYTQSSMRSAYHIRELDVYRLMQLRQPLDIFLSHDWPSRIADHGDKAQLCRCKKFLAKEVWLVISCAACRPTGRTGLQLLLRRPAQFLDCSCMGIACPEFPGRCGASHDGKVICQEGGQAPELQIRVKT